jgi:hypothetical protein
MVQWDLVGDVPRKVIERLSRYLPFSCQGWTELIPGLSFADVVQYDPVLFEKWNPVTESGTAPALRGQAVSRARL